jgi:hypothetical protein
VHNGFVEASQANIVRRLQMKRLLLLLVAVAVLAALAAMPVAAKSKGDGCVSIQSGLIKYPAGYYFAGQPVATGYDAYGYNYQARIFKGSYANIYLGQEGFPPYTGDDASYLAQNPTVIYKWYWAFRDVQITVKWNDAWISNTDCDGDGWFDAPFYTGGYWAYKGTGAWFTNHQSGSYIGADGKAHGWTYFVKAVAVPADANLIGGIWYTAGGTEIGPIYAGAVAVVQEVLNDLYGGFAGLLYKSPAGPGLGKW